MWITVTTFRRGRNNSFITLNLSVYGVLGGCTSFDSYVWNCAGLCIGQNILDIYALRKQYIKSGTGGVRGESSGASGEWKIIHIELFLCTFFGYFAKNIIIPSQTRFSLQSFLSFFYCFFVQAI